MAIFYNPFLKPKKKPEPARTREDAIKDRQETLINFLESDESELQLFDSLDPVGKQEYIDTFNEVYSESGKDKFRHISKREIGAGDIAKAILKAPSQAVPPTKEPKALNLYDAQLEYLYDAVEKGVLEPEKMDDDTLITVGSILNERESEKTDEIKVHARKRLDNLINKNEELQEQYYASPESKMAQFAEGVTKPFQDFGVWLADKIRGDESLSDLRGKADALERLAYPENQTWEGAGEIAALFGGTSAVYSGLAKKGLSRIVSKTAEKGFKFSTPALAATAVGEFGIGAAYNTPTFVLSPENPNRILSGIEAVFLGTALNLGIDTISILKGKPKADVVQHLDELKPEGWKEIKEGLLTRYDDASPQNIALAEQMQARPVVDPNQAKSAAAGRNLSDEYRALEAEQQQRIADFDAAKREMQYGSTVGGTQTAQDLQSAMQARQLQEPSSVPITQGESTAVTPEYRRKVEIEDRLVELQDRANTIKQRRGQSKKENKRIQDEVVSLKQERLLNETGENLNKYEQMAEEAYPGSVLGISPYIGDFQNMRRAVTRELGLRTGMGMVGSNVAEENDQNPFTGFLLGFMMPMPRAAILKESGEARGILPSLKFSDKYIKPLDQSIKDISPLVHNSANNTVRRILEESTNYIHRAEPFFKTLDKLVKSKQITMDNVNEITVHLFRRDREALYNAFERITPSTANQRGALQQAHKEVETVFDDLLLNAQDAGLNVKHLPNYFPMKVKDLELLREIRGYKETDLFTKAVQEFEEVHGFAPNSVEKAEIFSEVIRKQEGTKPSYMHQRKIDDISIDDLPAYENIRDSFSQYVGSIVEKTELNRFLGKSSKDIPSQQYGRILKQSVGNSINEMIQKLSAQGVVIDAKQAGELKKYLTSWTQNMGRGTNDWVNTYKNMFYASTIGNPFSALSQLPDIAIMATKDPKAFGSALVKAIGKRKLDFAFDRYGQGRIADDILSTGSGLRSAAKDLVKKPGSSKRWNRFSQKLLDKSLKWGGFKALDMAMKSLGTNTHYHRLKKWASAPANTKLGRKFERKYKEAFGNDFNALKDALKRGETDNPLVSQAVFNEITQIHPLSPLHMPQYYVENPQYKWMYSLKSFMLRHINFMRSELIGDIRKAKSGEEFTDAVGTYMTYVGLFSVATMGKSALNDFILGRDVTLSDLAAESMIQTLTGINRFQIYQVKDIFEENPFRTQSNLYNLIGSTVVPSHVLTDIASDVVKSNEGNIQHIEDVTSIKHIPVIGKGVYWRLGEGSVKEARKKQDRLHRLEKMMSGEMEFETVE